MEFKQIGNFVSVVATCPLNDETEDLPVAVSISEELCPFKLYNAISLNSQYSGSGDGFVLFTITV